MSDYIPIAQDIFLDNDLRTDCFDIRILDNDILEDPLTEDFTVRISNVISSNIDFRLFTSSQNVTVVIVDDDRFATIGFNESFYRVEEGQNVRVCVAVTMPAPMEPFVEEDVPLLVTTVPGSASMLFSE